MMLLYSHNDGLMCKVFLSSLEPTAIRRFNDLRKGFIQNFGELMQAFGARFIMCSKVPQPIDALLSMRMGNGKPFDLMRIGIRSCTMRLVEETSR